jgi:putative PIN family toxin of toxin-antitoxin system
MSGSIEKEKQALRVVVDTNILVASLFPGSSAALIDLWFEGVISLCISPAIVREYLHVLRSFGFRRDRLDLVVEALEERKHCLFAESPPQGRWVKDDPSDDKFVSCALALGARYIVSSDVHLKKLGHVEGTTVISSGEMLRIAAG